MAVRIVVRSFGGRVAATVRGVMQPRERTVSLRRSLSVVAVVLSVLGGIGFASAATVIRHGKPAAGKAQAPAGAVRPGGKAPAGAVRSRGNAPAGAVRYRGHV